MPKFPFTNYHELNLDWILKKVEALFTASEENARTIRTYDTRLTRAEQTATSAATAATSAQQLADAAAATAGDALSVAGTADAKADSALTAATSAASAASGALTVAQEARQIAGNAQSAAADAGALANDASNAAAAAQTTADTNAGNIATLQTTVETISGKVSDIDNKADVIISSASGITASFADGADDMPIRSLVTNIEPVQAGSGDPSPTNIRPITGRTGCSVVRTGKNLFNPTAIHENEYINSNGVITSNNSYAYSDKIKVFPNTLYSIQQNRVNNGTNVSIAYYNNDTFIRREVVIISGVPQFVSASFTTPDNCNYIAVSSFGKNATNIQLEQGTMTTYEPYTATTIDVSWQSEAGTVYGGTLDVISGLLTVTDFLYIYDGSEPFSKSGTALNGFYNNLFSSVPPHNWFKMRNYSGALGTLTDEMSSMFKMTNDASVYRNNYGYLMLDTGMNFSCDPDVFGTTVDSFKTKLAELYNSGNPVSVYAEILNPQTYQLTPQQINTLLGSNNIYSDVGSIADVQYPADTKLYIDGKIAELQALVLEN